MVNSTNYCSIPKHHVVGDVISYSELIWAPHIVLIHAIGSSHLDIVTF